MPIQERVWAAIDQLTAAAIPGLANLTPAFTTMLLTFDTPPDSFASCEARVLAVLASHADSSAAAPRTIEVPICYDIQCAPDIEDLARVKGLAPNDISRLHAAAEYTVAFIGFMPGFPYLHGLPDQLSTPRLPSPRPRVPAGSIGIAGSQTGIYPASTPGGWRLIGRTPLRLFDPTAIQPALFKPRDRVKFIAIDLPEFKRISSRIEAR